MTRVPATLLAVALLLAGCNAEEPPASAPLTPTAITPAPPPASPTPPSPTPTPVPSPTDDEARLEDLRAGEDYLAFADEARAAEAGITHTYEQPSYLQRADPNQSTINEQGRYTCSVTGEEMPTCGEDELALDENGNAIPVPFANAAELFAEFVPAIRDDLLLAGPEYEGPDVPDYEGPTIRTFGSTGATEGKGELQSWAGVYSDGSGAPQWRVHVALIRPDFATSRGAMIAVMAPVDVDATQHPTLQDVHQEIGDLIRGWLEQQPPPQA